jgi:hypothetical protein
MTVLADTRATHLVNAPLASIDLPEWLFSLSDTAYRACSPAHIAGGTSRADDGKRMSINVERIAGNMLIQHYVEDIAEPHHVRVNSLSDSFTDGGATQLAITWELTIAPVDDATCELSNRVIVQSTPSFLEMLRQAGISDMSRVIAQFTTNTETHNREETPFFARDIEIKAKAAALVGPRPLPV